MISFEYHDCRNLNLNLNLNLDLNPNLDLDLDLGSSSCFSHESISSAPLGS